MKKLVTYILALVMILISISTMGATASASDYTMSTSDYIALEDEGLESIIIPKPDNLPGPTEERQIQDEDTRKTFVQTLIPRYTVALIGFVAAFAFLYLVIAGVRFAVAYGNDEAIESAKKQATYAIIGLLVALLSYTIVTIIINLEFIESSTTGNTGDSGTEQSGSSSSGSTGGENTQE